MFWYVFFSLALGFFHLHRYYYLFDELYCALLLPMSTTVTATFILSPLNSLGYHRTAFVWLLGCDWKEKPGKKLGRKHYYVFPHTHTDEYDIHTHTYNILLDARCTGECVHFHILFTAHHRITHPLPHSSPYPCIYKLTEPRRFLFSILFFFHQRVLRRQWMRTRHANGLKLRRSDVVVRGVFIGEDNGGEKKTRQKPPPRRRLDFYRASAAAGTRAMAVIPRGTDAEHK